MSAKSVLHLCATATGVFSDVESGSWYEADVTAMADRGLLLGYEDGSFRPNRVITGAEFVSVVARCAGLVAAPSVNSHWAAGYLQSALAAGWYDWDELPPTGERFDQPIPRQLAVKILMRALLPDVRGDYATESQKIRDFSELDGRYYDAVLAAYSCGVAAGDDEGRFHPHGSLTRAEASALAMRALTLAGGGELPKPEPPAPPVTPLQGGVAQNGWLQVVGTALQNERGEPVVLRGMSSHGLQWYSGFTSAQSLRNTADHGANLFRVAMYTGEGGYLSKPAAMRQQLIAAVDAAIANDMYVIIDWHILSDGNPLVHVDEATAFFSEMAARYRDCPAVLYEICNEPNGAVSWSGEIKPYAERVIGAIRAHSPRAVILLGSGTWSQDIHLAAADPIAGENLMYTLHFYAGTHGAWLRERLDGALAAGLPVFVSEWGTSRADGSGGVFLEESGIWLDFLAARGISWANWSLCDKAESSAALRPGAPADRTWSAEELTPSGQFVFSHFRG